MMSTAPSRNLLPYYVVYLLAGILLLAAILTIAVDWAAPPVPGYPHAPPHPFPIDVVVTWVDGSDEAWRGALETARQEMIASPPDGARMFHSKLREPEAAVDSRARDEVYYNAALILKYMPWVRRYFLVTSRPQKPAWWPVTGRTNRTEFILVHHDVIWDAGTRPLPVFNSVPIQAHLANIAGLAEHFILFDDDCYVGRPMHPSHFFTKGGLPVARMVRASQPVILAKAGPPTDEDMWSYNCANTAAMILSEPDVQTIPDEGPYKGAHVCAPCLKSEWGMLVKQKFKAATAKLQAFRSDHDYTIQYVLLGILRRQGRVAPLPAGIRIALIQTGSLALARFDMPHLFCVNNRITDTDRAILDELLDQK